MLEKKEIDVLVVGAGFSGIGAAIAAGRKGLNVLLVEGGKSIGGVMSDCIGMPLGAGYPLDKPIGGIFTELVERLMAMSPPAAQKRECSLHEFGPEVLYDYDLCIYTMNQMIDEAGVKLLTSTIATDVETNNDEVKRVTLCNKSGQYHVYPKVVLDCSGDGDVSAKAGVPFTIGDDGKMMGSTLTFTMENAKWDEIFKDGFDPYFRKYTKPAIKKGLIHEDLEMLYLMKAFHQDTVYFNSVIVTGIDGMDQDSIDRGTQEGRKRCFELKDFVINSIPGFENSRMMNMAIRIGVRETRRLEGMHYLKGEELYAATKFDDGIVACDNPIDDVMRGESKSMTHDSIVEDGAYYTIPFSSLVPQKIKNLMFGGRLISSDPTAFASVRGMPQCMLMGQAIGVASFYAIKEKIAVQDLNKKLLVSELFLQGVNGINGKML